MYVVCCVVCGVHLLDTRIRREREREREREKKRKI